MLDRVSEVGVLPHVIFSILEPVGPEEPSPAQLETILAVDPGFSAKVLVLANSAPFGRPAQVVSIREATQILGYRTIRTLAMTAGTFEMFVGKNDPFSLRRRRWWRQAVDAAAVSAWLARETGRADEAEAYTAGLLHLLGKSLLDRYGGQDYTLVTERQASGQSDYDAETVVFGCDHVSLLCSLCDRWNLPERLVSALSYHVPPESCEDVPLRACVAIASRAALASCRGPELARGELASTPEWAFAMLGIGREKLRGLAELGIGSPAASR